MPLITLDQISLAFGHLPLLDRADLRIEPGERLALIGRNGAGKSSLLKVLTGELAAEEGTIWRGPGVRIARLEQDVPAAAERRPATAPGNADGPPEAPASANTTVFDEVASGLGALGDLVADYHHAARHLSDAPPAEADAALARLGALQHALEEQDGWRLEQRVESVVSRLALPADRAMRELSGGWRRRALLGKALVAEPDVLLLDEPTNHLDIDAIQWLEDYLRTYAGAILFVTHDRTFLANLATRIIELDRGRLTSWPGSYATYLQKKADALETEARDLDRLDRKLEKEEAWLRQGVKARRTRNEGRVKDLLRLREQRAAYRAQPGQVRLAIDTGDATGKLVFEAKDVSKRLGGVPIITNYSQRILRGDRVGLIGPNGSGKTTLLRLLVGELEPDSGVVKQGSRLQIAYFDQQREQLDPDTSVADSVHDGNDTVIVNGQPRHIIGYLADFLFPRERAMSPVRTLSGGERNRLLLARLFARPANVLVLDEPTNDLDIETLELLEELIGGFDGTVLLVSHDRAFLDNIVTSTLSFEGGGRVVESVGGWQDYVRQKAAAESAAGRRAAAVPARNEPVRQTPSATKGKKLSYRERQELDSLPAHIESLEQERSRLQQESASPEFYKTPAERIRGVLARIDAIAPELEAALARWVELEERAG